MHDMDWELIHEYDLVCVHVLTCDVYELCDYDDARLVCDLF